MVGKTVDEIKAMKVKQKDESHPAVPDVPELTSLVTVTVHEYLEAVAEAYENATGKGAHLCGPLLMFARHGQREFSR